MDIYADNILDHYRHPRNAGALAMPSVRWNEVNVSCGDSLTLFMRIENDTIAEVRWEGTGCAISQAAMSLLSEELPGMTLSDAQAIVPSHVRDLLGVPVGTRRIKCAFLCLHALKNAIRSIKKVEPQDWAGTLRE